MKCKLEWFDTNKISSNDPCYPCNVYSSSSIILFSLLSSFLFIMLWDRYDFENCCYLSILINEKVINFFVFWAKSIDLHIINDFNL